MKSETPKRSSVKLPDDVMNSARVVVALRGDTTLSELLAGILRPILFEMERKALAKKTGGKTGPYKKGGGK